MGNPILAGGYWSPFKIISREYHAIYYYHKYGQVGKIIRVKIVEKSRSEIIWRVKKEARKDYQFRKLIFCKDLVIFYTKYLYLVSFFTWTCTKCLSPTVVSNKTVLILKHAFLTPWTEPFVLDCTVRYEYTMYTMRPDTRDFWKCTKRKYSF